MSLKDIPKGILRVLSFTLNFCTDYSIGLPKKATASMKRPAYISFPISNLGFFNAVNFVLSGLKNGNGFSDSKQFHCMATGQICFSTPS
jgi:hypothetical protein